MRLPYLPRVLALRKPKYSIIGGLLKKRRLGSYNVLDVGVANNSQCEWLSVFKGTAIYDGIDYVRPSGFSDGLGPNGKTVCHFYEADLNRVQPSELVSQKYDIICASHVLEHLLNPYSLVPDLLNVLNPGGIIYLEYPNLSSVQRSWVSSYWFYGDSTHIQPVSTSMIIESCRGVESQILDFGRCRPIGKLIFSGCASLSKLCLLRPGWRDPLLYLAGMVDFCLIGKP
jgi:SAM-dependent methyltransferase